MGPPGREAERRRKNARVNHQGRAIAGETDTQNLNKRSYNNNTQNQSIHLRGRVGGEEHKRWASLNHTCLPAQKLCLALRPNASSPSQVFLETGVCSPTQLYWLL